MTNQIKIFNQALIGIVIFLLTCTQDSLFEPSDTKSVICYAFLSDTLISNITIQDTSKLSTIDTIHTANSAVFVGFVIPTDGKIARAYWEFGDNQGSSVKILKHKYAKSGVYTAVFTIEDYAELTMKDTVVVHVNTPPSIDTLLLPYNGQTGIDPTDPRGIYFSWSHSEQDSGDTILIDLYISSDTTFLQPSVSNIDTNFYDYKGSIDILKTYFWRIVISDRYNDSDTSDIYRFSTKDPNAVDGILKGYALFEGWTNHAGIKITITYDETYVRTATTTNTGYYEIIRVTPKDPYCIAAKDVIKNEFISDTVFHPINMGEITIADTMILKDIFKPVISDNNPTGTQTIRQPQVSVSFSDIASGILKSTVVKTVNDSDYTNEAAITDTGLIWIPQYRLHDGDYTVRVTVSDSAGNEADQKEWTFTVDAMKLYAMQDTTVRINDTVNMYGRVSDVYSKVVEYKWDFNGDGTWEDSILTSDTVISCPWVYTHENIYGAILYVRDDSGMVKLDTAIITVGNTPPVIDTIRPDTTISIFDSVPFYGSTHDVDGVIKEYAWDFDGNGSFDYTSATVINTGYRYNIAGTYNAILLVTDDDNKRSFDTAVITVLQDVPIINFASDDTIVAYGGTVKCSVYVQQQFGTITVEMDTVNDGNWVIVTDNEVSALKNIAVGTASFWDSVKVRVTDDDGNMLDTAFKVDIRPRPLTVTSIDSTVNTLTVNFSQTQESDFKEYKIYRSNTNVVDTNNELWATITDSGTISYSIVPSYNWIPRYYRIYQKDSEGLCDTGSNIVYGNIVNSPPSTPVITYPVNDGDSIWSNEIIKWSCSDPNDHMVKYDVHVNYNDTGYHVFKTALTDTFVQLSGYDSLFIRWKVIAYDSEIDSSGWSDERTSIIKTTVSDIDGNIYKVIRIGTQLWLAENLKTTRYNDGTAIPPITDDSAWSVLTSPGYCYYVNDSASNAVKYGAFYNWYTVNTGKLAPAGWHVPTDEEWDTLQNYLIANGYNWDGTTTGNKIAKSMAAKTDWNSSSIQGSVGNDMSTNNSSGFSALPGGCRGNLGNFNYQGDFGHWWSVTECDASNAFNSCLYYDYYYLSWFSNRKSCGFSIRLLRDN